MKDIKSNVRQNQAIKAYSGGKAPARSLPKESQNLSADSFGQQLAKELDTQMAPATIATEALDSNRSDLLKVDAESAGLKLSGHAAKRIEERKLDMDTDEFFKLRSAIDQLKKKGGSNSLVVTPKAAYIVDVAKDTVVTAIDKESMSENVFTKIDSTLFIN